jgi:hypothetical protein
LTRENLKDEIQMHQSVNIEGKKFKSLKKSKTKGKGTSFHSKRDSRRRTGKQKNNEEL